MLSYISWTFCSIKQISAGSCWILKNSAPERVGQVSHTNYPAILSQVKHVHLTVHLHLMEVIKHWWRLRKKENKPNSLLCWNDFTGLKITHNCRHFRKAIEKRSGTVQAPAVHRFFSRSLVSSRERERSGTGAHSDCINHAARIAAKNKPSRWTKF